MDSDASDTRVSTAPTPGPSTAIATLPRNQAPRNQAPRHQAPRHQAPQGHSSWHRAHGQPATTVLGVGQARPLNGVASTPSAPSPAGAAVVAGATEQAGVGVPTGPNGDDAEVLSKDDMVSRLTREVSRRVGAQKYAMWFQRAARFQVVAGDGAASGVGEASGASSRVLLTVPNQFVADWIDREFHGQMAEAARACLGEGAEVAVCVDARAFLRESVHSAAAAAAATPSAESASEASSASASDGAMGGAHRGQGDGGTASEGSRGMIARGLRGFRDAPGPRPIIGFVDADPTPDRATATRDTPPPTRSATRPHGPEFRRLIRTVPMRHRLEDFVVGPANQLAYTAAEKLASPPEDGHALLANCVFIHGGCGMGKTHLLQGVCKAYKRARPEATVLYTTGEQFMNAFIEAVREKTLDRFRRELRDVDLLALDDVHFIADKDKTQAEFLRSFDCIERTGAQVILASDSHPRHIQHFSEALVSRCLQGLVTEVREPDAETRLRLIHVLAKRKGMLMQAGAAQMLAEFLDTFHPVSVRVIEGLVVKLHALAENDEAPGFSGGASGPANIGAPGHPSRSVAPTPQRIPRVIGLSMVDRLIQTERSEKVRRVVTTEDVVDAACEVFRLVPVQLLSKSRHRQLVLARAICIHLLREYTSMSYPEIARAMRRTNHSTVITAYQRLQEQLGENDTMLLPGLPEPVTAGVLLNRVRHGVQRRVA